MNKIETQFGIGDKVVIISSITKRDLINCEACSGKGHVIVDGFRFRCETCLGNATKIVWGDIIYSVLYKNATIGQINIRLSAKKKEVQYMVEETGIGSGTCWDENDCFPNEIDALTECEKRNANIALKK